MTGFEELHPRAAVGTFADKPQSAPELALEAPAAVYSDEDLNGSYASRNALVADVSLHRWPGVDHTNGADLSLSDNQALLNHVVQDLVFWSDWACTRAEFGAGRGYSRRFLEVDILQAEMRGRRHFSEETETQDEELITATTDEIASEAEDGDTSAPQFTPRRSARPARIRERVARAHEGMTRWNVRQTPLAIQEHTLSDTLADLMHWSKRTGTDFGQAMSVGLAVLEDETGR